MNALEIEPIIGKRILFPPSQLAIRLDEGHRRAYRRLSGLVFPLAGVPALKDHDFDGRSLKLTRRQLATLNRAFSSLNRPAEPGMQGAFEEQEQWLSDHFKEMQLLS